MTFKLPWSSIGIAYGQLTDEQYIAKLYREIAIRSEIIDLLHNLKIIEEFLGETKSSRAAYMPVREEQRGVSTTK